MARIKMITTKFPAILFFLYVTHVPASGVAVGSGSQDAFQNMLDRCCAIGSDWSNNHNTCNGYTSPISGISVEHQAICLSTISICCVRLSRFRACKVGQETARLGQDCKNIPKITGGEAHKDCCKACKLGLIASSMKLPCTLTSFRFGYPWDDSFMECCKSPKEGTNTNNGGGDSGVCANSACDHLCFEETVSAYRCGCRSGYRLQEDHLSCRDINECEEGIHNCTSDKDCINVSGGYQCYPRDTSTGQQTHNCPIGFQKNIETKTCDDVNECNTHLHNCASDTHTCINTIGSFDCRIKNSPISPCLPGFEFSTSQDKCIDEDECSKREDSCNRVTEVCVNKIGGYTCDPKPASQCGSGYRLNVSTNKCEDINECVSALGACAATEFCLNTPGGFTCHKVSTEGCPPGYKPSDSELCSDVDECAEKIDTCDSTLEVCSNHQGGYRCVKIVSCPAGYKPHVDGLTCIDVDECAEGIGVCNNDDEVCVNLNGTYTCKTDSTGTISRIQCPTGYKLDPQKYDCEDLNECDEENGGCDPIAEECVNTLGSFQCIKLVSTKCDSSMQFSPTFGRCVVPARIISRPLNNSVREGDLVKFECDVDGSPRPSVTWYKDGSKRFAAENEGRILFSNNKNKLFIMNVKKSDVGVYMCEAYNGVDAARAKATLNILDECKLGTHKCTQSEECVPTEIGYECRSLPTTQRCSAGYEKQGTECIDINECQRGYHNCPRYERCDNTVGSFTCSRVLDCGTGYTWNSYEKRCEDNDECELNTHQCGSGFVCTNTQGSFRCEQQSCKPGYKLSPDGMCEYVYCEPGYEGDEQGNCRDVDECLSDPCRKDELCANTDGGYLCRSRLICGNGYRPNEYGTQCVDINECEENTDQCADGQVCENSLGGYKCKCPIGHRLNRYRKCEDIDECVRYSDQVCAANSICENTLGSYKCNCKKGFRQLSDGRNCEDIDECQNENACQHRCANTWGSYQCSCNRGFELSPDSRSCIDVNECEKYKSRGRLCVGYCVNEPGSYSCSCPSGYRLSTDKYTCIDIDECKEEAVCSGTNQVCLNTRGSYKCNVIRCPANYVRDDAHKNRCKRASLICGDQDNNCLNIPVSYSFNYITFPSKMPIPPARGKVDLFTMQGPRWKGGTSRFELKFVRSSSFNRQHKVGREYFRMRNSANNRAVVSLLRSIVGPQEIELELILNMYYNGVFGGKAVAKIFLIIPQYDF